MQEQRTRERNSIETKGKKKEEKRNEKPSGGEEGIQGERKLRQ